MNKNRVVVAMSGGVDSSVAAWLLKKQGYDVIGITMCFNISHGSRKRPSCCGIEGIEDAKRVAEKIGIRHYVLNFSKELESQIIDNFCSEYLKGRTPNPCVRCNQFLKFDSLLKKAKTMDAQFLATGHYARVVYSHKKKRYLLKKGKDKRKDQSYFLYSIKKETLPYILMPLGSYTKKQIRVTAKKIGIKVADKPASQEICFISDDYRDFLKHRLSKSKIKPGPIVDTEGKFIGQHKGICFYTVGQREGLRIALGYRAYIAKIDVRKNKIVVGKEQKLYSDSLIAEKPNFISIDYPKKKILAKAKIRYNHKEADCRISPFNRNRVKVEFFNPQRAITPGQSVVFYNKDILLGGGIIQKSL
ncbi:MAG: tRNA 2-thiouridine(34) synthase MnmA [Candidatus Omnitrophota bacterium]